MPTPMPMPTAAAAGKLLYMSHCAGCHTAAPVNNANKILRGANSASTILNAIAKNIGGMGALQANISAQNASDLAAYLATPTL